ncbi:MAG TPA: septum formation initiator family protein [Candidatus Mediterraneibacter cottocaccae]|nr:septum formation initiator family protein [Candidatus Mediterraneibacter cottocaccae]
MKNRKKAPAAAGRSRKRRAGLGRHKRSVLMICLVLVFLTGVVAVDSLTLQAKNAEYKAQEAELKEQLRAEEERSEEVDEFREYVNTDEYTKEIAEEKLGLVDPNEIVFKPAK